MTDAPTFAFALSFPLLADVSGGAFDTLGGDGDISFDFNAFENSLKALLGVDSDMIFGE